jgi:hypothetical protein
VAVGHDFIVIMPFTSTSCCHALHLSLYHAHPLVVQELASKHYAEHDGKPFFPKLVNFLSSGPVVAMVWEGKDVVKYGRTMIGATNPLASAPGTIRWARLSVLGLLCFLGLCIAVDFAHVLWMGV